MHPEDDYMEIGERGLISHGEGFIEKVSGKYIHPDDLVYDKNGEVVAFFEDEEEFDRELDEEDY